MPLAVSRRVPSRCAVISCCTIASLLLLSHTYITFDTKRLNITRWKIQHSRYTKLFQITNPEFEEYIRTEDTIPATGRYLFPPVRHSREPFNPREIGDCTSNGDSEMKKLSPRCGCLPQALPDPRLGPVHPCCSRHLVNMLRDVYAEVMKIGVPLVLLGGPVIGWYRNKKLIPYDLDLDAGLPWELWNTPQFNAMLKRLADKGYCVWFRDTGWTKIWSSVVAFDLLAWNLIDGRIQFSSAVDSKEYNVSLLLPPRQVVLEGHQVYIPNQPVQYMDWLYGKGKWRHPLNCTKIIHRKCVE